MAKQEIDIGVEGNDGTGDSIRESFRKVNENFNEIYAVFGEGGQITFTSLGDTPEFLSPRTIPLVDDAAQNIDLVALKSDAQEGAGEPDSVLISYDQAGYIILKTAFRRLSQDPKPILGQPLDARGSDLAENAIGIALGPKSISEDAVVKFNSIHDGDNITIDDLVISKGYADSRYIAGDLPIRLEDEPVNASEYTLTIESYDNGRINLSDHGFDRTVNGTPYVFNAEDNDPSNLTSGVTYYLRYYNSNQLSIHASAEDAKVQSQATADANRILASGTIATDDTHTFLDAGYDENLTGFFLSNEAVPRKSLVRRQGDTMTGPLILNDNPGELAGLTSSPEELQAATKFYADNTSYSSINNLFVSTQGDDSMRGVPAGKEGTSWNYAYASINAAARRAEEMMKASEAEPGPYMQTITRDDGAAPTTVIPAGSGAETGISVPRFSTARQLIDLNRQYIIREVTAYLNYAFPDFDYNIDTCERDLGLILDAISFDINRSVSDAQNNANSLTRRAAERYYANASGRIAITRQYNETIAAIQKAKDIVAAILVNRPLQQIAIAGITNQSIAKVETSVPHGYQDKNIVIIKDVVGLTELNDNLYYIKVISNTEFELFNDIEFDSPVDTSALGLAVGGVVGLRYQTDDTQYVGGTNAVASAINGVNEKFDLVVNILTNGIDAGADVIYGRTYYVLVDPGNKDSTDQAISTNRDVIPGKIIVGKLSGAQGRVVNYYASNDPANPEGSGNIDVIEVNILKPIDFVAGEGIEYGNFVNRRQVTIFIESGQYEEDYPIKVAANVSIKGDEFRRVIIRPKNRVSQSPWAKTYIYRDREFDGLTVSEAGARFYNQTNEFQGHFGYHYLSNPEKPINTGPTVINPGRYDTAAAILRENKGFIVNETISYINNNSTDILYDHEKFGEDLEAIITGITYDMVLGSNYNQTYYGLQYFQREKSDWTDSQVQAIWVDGLTEAKRLVGGITSVANNAGALAACNNAFDAIINIIQNGNIDTDDGVTYPLTFNSISSSTTDRINAAAQLQANRDFIAAEALAYLDQVSGGKYINTATRLRDYKNLVDAMTYDMIYGGNFGAREFARGLFFEENDQLRLEITTREETLTTLDRFLQVAKDVITETTVVKTEGNTETQDGTGTPATGVEEAIAEVVITKIKTQIQNQNTLDLGLITYPSLVGADPTLVGIKSDIDGAYTTIEPAVITYQDAQPSALFNYQEAKCRRDTGLIIEALIDDLTTGGDEQTTEVQGQYLNSYISLYNSNGFGGQEYITKQAILNIYTIVDRLFDGAYDTGLYEQNSGDADFIAPDFQYGTAEATTDDKVNALIAKIVYAFRRDYNPPKRNDEMDCFLMNDATILRNITCQGHGGFLCVLDPDGQILTKSPYIQTGSSFSKSINSKIFAGGMFVDAYAGNIPVYVPETIDPDGEGAVSGKTNNFELWVRSEDGQGLFIREPQLPCPFYVEGRRYQVNAISNYSQGNGWCKIYLDASSNEGNGYRESDFNEKVITISTSHVPALGEQIQQANSGAFGDVQEIRSNTQIVVNNIVGTFTTNAADTITGAVSGAYGAYPIAITGLFARNLYLQTAGNRSMLGNDFTQINDLGYALVTNNGAFSEMVSMFTYYCHAAYYAKNGSEIRSLNGSNGYGNFGLVAEGADPNEIPDQITYGQSMAFPVKSYTFLNGATNTNIAAENAIFVTDAFHPPQPNSIVEIDHGGSLGILRYRISAVNEVDTAPAPAPTGGVYNNTVYRLQLAGTPGGENGEFFSSLQDTIANGTFINFRSSESHILTGVRDKDRLVNRPSTAINFDESDGITYRSISFSGSDNYGNSLPADAVQSTFNIPYDVVELQVDFANSTGGKGSSIGDTTIAISMDGDADGRNALDAEEITRLTRDIAGRQPGDVNYSGGMIFSYEGRTHQITNFTDNGGGSGEITIASSPVHDITGGGTGIAAAVQDGQVIYAALPLNSTGEVTINISLCRATGHDFTQIGTGGFNTSNYPNVILGDPVGGLQASLAPFYEDAPNATKAQVWERRKGRVFWMSTDQYGFFRVGQFFSIDQAQGSITFSGEIGITNANELGFKKGVTVDEFSIDDSMADESDSAVPVEKAIVNYINKRLGRDKNDNLYTPFIGPGFLALSGNSTMTGDLKMGTNKIINLQTPDNGSDAANKSYVDSKVLENDNFAKLREANQSKSGLQAGDWLAYSGLRKAYTKTPVDTGAGSLTFAVNDAIENSTGNKTATIKDITFITDQILGENEPGNVVYIITYQLGLGSADFLENEDIIGTGAKSTVEAEILRGPFDEILNATNNANSDFTVTFDRVAGVIDDNLDQTIATFDFQLRKVVENADVTDSAAIEQSKLLMNRAGVQDSSAGLFGSNDDTGQANRGLSVFDGDNLTEEVRIDLSTTITAAPGDILYQGSKKGTVVEQVTGQNFAIIRTSDTWTADATDITKSVLNDGRIGAANSLSATVTSVKGSGFIGIKDRSIGFDKFDEINSGLLIGRAKRDTPDTGAVESITFDTVVDQGFALQDKDFEDAQITEVSGQRLLLATRVDADDGETITQQQGGTTVVGTVQGKVTSEFIIYCVDVVVQGTSTPATFQQGSIIGNGSLSSATTVNSVNGNFVLLGEAMVRQEDGVYGTTPVATGSSGNSIVRRTANGSLQATSIIVGGSSTNTILSVNSNTLNVTTPQGANIFSATGANSSLPTMDISGNVEIGDMGYNTGESVLKNGSTFGTTGGAVGGTDETSALAVRWIYSSFIEAPSEKATVGGGTGIAIGSGSNLPSDADGTIIIVSSGEEIAVFDETNGVDLNGNTDIDGSLTLTSTGDLTVRGEGNISIRNAANTSDQFLVDGSTGNVTAAGSISAGNNSSVTGTFDVSGATTLAGGYGNSGVTISAAGDINANGSVIIDGSISASGNATLGSNSADTITMNGLVNTNIIPATNGNRNLGSNGNRWGTVYGDTFSGTATTAKYADLAENYLGDASYDPGTVVVLGGEAEVTLTSKKGDHRVAGVVTTNPAHLMNSTLQGDHVIGIALQGRVPCKVLGKVSKGDIIVTSAIPGYGCVDNNPSYGAIIGKAIEDKDTLDKGVIEVLVGKA
jgi:hypothetical protein